MSNSGSRLFRALAMLSVLYYSEGLTSLSAQETKPDTGKTSPEQSVPVILDEPKFIDEANFIHPKLLQKATVQFKGSTLSELGTWLEKTTGLPVIFDEIALADEGWNLDNKFDADLTDEPIYLLLNLFNLSSFDFVWYVENDTLFITTELEEWGILTQRAHSILALVNQGYRPDQLIETIQRMTSGPWWNIDQEGGDLSILGNTLFVRQTHTVQREVAALLSALEKHGAATFTLEPANHSLIRECLQQNDSFDFKEESLANVAAELSKRFKFGVSIDEDALSDHGRSGDDLVSFSLKDRQLSQLLKQLLEPLALVAIPHNGRLLITSDHEASLKLQTVVFDVRDLCRDAAETDALMVTIQEQTSGPWWQIDQDGGDTIAARPGTLVVRQTEETLAQVIDFLQRYRAVRTPDSVPEQLLGDEAITLYYKLDTQIAVHLQQQLPLLVHTTMPTSTIEGPQNINNFLIVLIPSTPMFKDPTGAVLLPGAQLKTEEELVPQSTLIITHRRKIHYEIQKIIARIKNGDNIANTPSGMKLIEVIQGRSRGPCIF